MFKIEQSIDSKCLLHNSISGFTFIHYNKAEKQTIAKHWWHKLQWLDSISCKLPNMSRFLLLVDISKVNKKKEQPRAISSFLSIISLMFFVKSELKDLKKN